MIKNLCLALAFFYGLIIFAQTTAIPDTNFEQFLVDQGIDTNGMNGNILDVDAQAVNALNVTRNDITDFTGLEAFVNLTSLNAGTNQFATLPLNTLLLLEELVFNQNVVLANLDLSSNSNLRLLNIRANGGTNTAPMATLDLSNNLLLEYIHIYNFRNLANVIFPNTDTVEYVYLLQTAAGITVDFSGYDSLETLTLSTNFDNALPINAVLPNNQNTLKSASFQGGNIINPDLSNFLALEYLSFQTSNVETLQLPITNTLERIRISSHNISNINFQNASGLLDLQITNKSTPGPLNLDITNNAPLQRLDASNNNITNIDITQNVNVLDVNLSNNDMTGLNTDQNTSLQDLNVSRNQITALNLSQNTVLEDLNASDNLLPSIDVSSNIVLTDLNVGNNEIPNLDVTNNPELFRLDISQNLFTTTGLDLTQNPELDNLNASDNQIESLNISQNPRLGTLVLTNNLFTGTDIIDQYHTIWSNRGALNASDRLDVSFNQLSGRIPDFAALIEDRTTNYFEFRFNDNNFEFGDFETEHAAYLSALTETWSSSPFLPFWRDYDYAPQAKVNAIESPTRNAGENITLTTTVRGAQNHYQWFKDGVPIPDTDSPEYTITDLNTCDAGVYHSEITSDLVPFENSNPPGTNGKNLLLVRNDITLAVNATKDCVTLANPMNTDTNVPFNSGIEWTDNPGACGYKITLRNVDTNTVIETVDVGEVTLYNPTTDFPQNTTIGVTVTPYYDDGDFGGCTEETFTTNATAVEPDCTSLNSPRNGDINVPVDIPSISWNPANGADAYKIEITSTSGNNDLPLTDLGDVLTHPFSGPFQNGDLVTVTLTPYNSVGDATGPCASESFIITGSASNRPFITTWQTTTANEAITIPTTGGGYNYTVDWGDGTITTGETGNATHTYVAPGIYTVSITGDFPRIYFNTNGNPTATDNSAKILTIEQWGNNPWTSMERAFTGCINLTGNFSDIPDLSNVTNTAVMFATCRLFNSNINNWDMGNVTNMEFMFQNNGSFDQPLDSWDVTSLTNATNMLQGVTLSTANYDALLIGWNSQNLQPNVTFNGGFSQYCDGAAARANMTSSDNWTITDGGPAGSAVNYLADQNHADSYTLPVITGTQLTGTEAYYTETNGGGTRYTAGDIINFADFPSYPVTLYIYDGAVSCSSEESFQLILTSTGAVPSCTSLAAPGPVDNDTDVAVDISGISWNSISDATGYRLAVSSTSGNNDMPLTDLNNVLTHSFATPFQNGDVVTITIIPYNGTGDATGPCTDESFTIVAATATVPSSCSDLASPSAGETDVPSDIASISWEAVSDATAYRVSIEGSSSNVNDITDRDITGTSFSLPGNFDNGETVAVTIIPFNSTGDAVGCATSQNFTIVAADAPVVPACAEFVAELSGATDVAVTSAIAWNDVNTADGYFLSIRTDAGGVILPETDLGILTSYALPEDLPFSTTIFVSITPYNAEGTNDSCTELSFVTVEEPEEPEEPLNEDETKYGFSPDGDGINEFWEIDGIENHPENVVYIYNRWGDMVFHIEGYDNQSNVFRGEANKLNGLGADTLPAGTYFFRIQVSGETTMKKLTGYLVIKR